MDYLISLCIPTNGISEWIFPVLESIYAQGIDEKLFEVVVCDNGHNADFQQRMADYCQKHENLNYGHTDAPLFLSEPETYRMAKGKLIKFINHRTKLRQGALKYWIDYVVRYGNDTAPPILYFSNGTLSLDSISHFNSFSDFVCALKIYGTWSTGMAIWKKDFDKIPSNERYNELFPHTTLLFRERERGHYIIDDTLLLDEIPSDQSKKGQYDLFYAFAVEWMMILGDLLRSRDITYATFFALKKETLKFCIGMAFDFMILRKPCSYDTSSFWQNMKVFYCPFQIFKELLLYLPNKGLEKLKKSWVHCK